MKDFDRFSNLFLQEWLLDQPHDMRYQVSGAIVVLRVHVLFLSDG